MSSTSREREHTDTLEIKKVVAAQLIDQLLTESGSNPLDWQQVSQRIYDALQTTAADDFEQGYWVDINQAVPPGKISFDIESLKRDLAEDIRSGLNWSPAKQFFFLVSVFSPGPTPVIPADEPESNGPDGSHADDQNDSDEKPDLDEVVAALPELREKEAAALVEARNSVVAAWLWRKHAADTRLSLNEIQIAPCCTFIPVK